MLRSCIQDIHNQSYKNIHHAINIAVDSEKEDYSCLYDDINSNVTVVYNWNSHQQINHFNAIEAVDYKQFDIFIKVDDDDIYKSNYVKNIVECFNDIDIVSSYISTQLNGYKIFKDVYDDLGANPEGSDYGMPMTLAFNKKALEIAKSVTNLDEYEDKLWRDAWTEAGLVHKLVKNDDEVIWYIHGANISTSKFLIE
jgi:hypothetical protein